MALPLWALADLEAVCGRDAVLEAFDDDNDGEPDADAIERLQTGSDAYVLGLIRGSQHVANMAGIIASPPSLLVTLSLDYAMAQVWKRAPSRARSDYVELERAVRQQCMDIRNGVMRLDIEGIAPPDPANVGGIVADQAGSLTEAPTKFFIGEGGLGDF